MAVDTSSVQACDHLHAYKIVFHDIYIHSECTLFDIPAFVQANSIQLNFDISTVLVLQFEGIPFQMADVLKYVYQPVPVSLLTGLQQWQPKQGSCMSVSTLSALHERENHPVIQTMFETDISIVPTAFWSKSNKCSIPNKIRMHVQLTQHSLILFKLWPTLFKKSAWTRT